MTTRPHESEAPGPRAISQHADEWIRQFIKHLELNLVARLPPDASDSELRVAAVRAILETLIESGRESESILELLAQADIERRCVEVGWSAALNQRRFELIDKEIQGSLTPAESIELAGLTRCMRDSIESETNLPMEGARALHRKLLHLKSTSESE